MKEQIKEILDSKISATAKMKLIYMAVNQEPEQKRYFIVWWRHRDTVGYKALETKGRLFDHEYLTAEIAGEEECGLDVTVII